MQEYLRTGLVSRLPSAVLAVGLALTGMLGLTAGLMLHTVNRRFQELDYLVRLRMPDRARRKPVSKPKKMASYSTIEE